MTTRRQAGLNGGTLNEGLDSYDSTIYATLSITESADTISAIASAAVNASLGVTESDDTVSSAANVALTALLNQVEAGDTLVSYVGVGVTASASMSESGDTLTATVSIVSDKISPESLDRLAEIWARLELDALNPVSTDGKTLTFGPVTQAISKDGAVRSGASLSAAGTADLMITEIWQRFGLDAANPLVQSESAISFGAVNINLVSEGQTITAQRS